MRDPALWIEDERPREGGRLLLPRRHPRNSCTARCRLGGEDRRPPGRREHGLGERSRSGSPSRADPRGPARRGTAPRRASADNAAKSPSPVRARGSRESRTTATAGRPTPRGPAEVSRTWPRAPGRSTDVERQRWRRPEARRAEERRDRPARSHGPSATAAAGSLPPPSPRLHAGGSSAPSALRRSPPRAVTGPGHRT